MYKFEKSASPSFARSLIQGLESGEWTSVSLVQHFQDRILERNPTLHAVHSLNPAVLKQARVLDRRRTNGEDIGPLSGLPMTLKDAFACKGLKTSYGLPVYASMTSTQDCAIVATLRKAGALFLGHSAVPTGSFDWNCQNMIYPECVNPHNERRTPGGSSGGAAAALAAGLTPLELGSDVAGSIRYPAHCCGVYGLRTTDGWLPFSDIGPGHGEGFRHLATCGPMARNLEDLIFLTDILTRAHPSSRQSAFNDILSRPLKVAFTLEMNGINPDPATLQVLSEFETTLTHSGHQIFRHVPDLPWEDMNQLWASICGYELAHSLPAMLPKAMRPVFLEQLLFRKLGPGWMKPALMAGTRLSDAAYLKSLNQLYEIRDGVDGFFQNYDLWVLPVSGSAAIARQDSGKTLKTHLGPISYSDYLSAYLCGTTLMGTPALTVPMGEDAKGMPIGLQIHGPRFSDVHLLKTVAQLLEKPQN